MTREELTKEINNLEKEKAEINKKIDDLTKELNNLISLDPTIKVDIKDIIYDGAKICLLDFDSEEEIAFSKLKEIVLSKNEIIIRNIKYLDSSLINKIVSLGKVLWRCAKEKKHTAEVCRVFVVNDSSCFSGDEEGGLKVFSPFFFFFISSSGIRTPATPQWPILRTIKTTYRTSPTTRSETAWSCRVPMARCR